MADTLAFLLILLLFSFTFTEPIFSVQKYDQTPCNTTTPPLNGATYTCNSNTKTCNTYVVYRPQFNQTLSNIATLFNVNESQLQFTTHFQDREVVIPIVCDCPDWASRAVVNYINDNLYSFTDIACGVYQGMMKPFVLEEQNGDLNETTLVKVPVKCACANTSQETNETRYLVTYPVMENDTIDIIALKFGVAVGLIQDANGLKPRQTIFGGTTLLVPTTGVPVLNLDLEVNSPGPKDIIPFDTIVKRSKENRFSVFLTVFASISLFCVILFLLYLKWKFHHGKPQPESVTGFNFTRFSPDLLDGMSKLKHALTSYSFDELKLATHDFSQSSLIGKSMYKGQLTGDLVVTIEEMNSIEKANHVINILTTINHFNVVKLEGGCLHMNQSYLVFEFAENGSLRNCLQDSIKRKRLTWAVRVKIAFDLAEGLHYIHYCTKPTYVHGNISSENVLITMDWRAKISGFSFARPIVCTKMGSKDWRDGDGGDGAESVIGREKTAEYLSCEEDSSKVDVYAYGVVLMELLSAKEAAFDWKWLDHVEGMVEEDAAGGSPENLEKFKVLMDVDLEGEYGLEDAVCLALLAKWCTRDDPNDRPTMNDVLKALWRIL